MQPCCENPDNLSAPKEVKEDLVIRVCIVCGRRHFELAVDPLVLNLRGI